MPLWVWVAVGGALGGMARFWVSGLVGQRLGEAFPWGTLVVNASGALAIGIAAGLLTDGATSAAWHVAAVGFLGSYTTVSSFSLQTLALAREGRIGRAAWNVAGSLGLCLAAAALGLAVGRVWP